MSVLVVDFYSSPPRCATDEGDIWIVTDTWQGEGEDVLHWDGESDGVFRPGRLTVRSPAAYLERISSEYVAAALVPFWERFEKLLGSHRPDWGVMLVPFGTSPDTALVLKEAAMQACISSHWIVADSAPLLAASCLSTITDTKCFVEVVRYRSRCVDSSSFSIVCTGMETKMVYLAQYRNTNKDRICQRHVLEDKDQTIVLDINEETIDKVLKSTSCFLESLRTGQIRLHLNRNGSIGLRCREDELLPLLSEKEPVTVTVTKRIRFSDHPDPSLEFWFGISNVPMHFLRELFFTRHRFESPPIAFEIATKRNLDGSLSIRTQWENQEQILNMFFPIMMM